MRIISLLGLVLLLVACGDDGDAVDPVDAPPDGPQGPPPQVGELYAELKGEWGCETTFPAGALGPGAPEMGVSGHLQVADNDDLGGYWYRGIYATEPSETMPTFRVEFFMGYGELTGLAFLVGVDNIGGTSTGTSAGWKDDVLTYEGHGYSMGQAVKTRESMTKNGTAEVVHRLEVDAGDGYQPKVETVCKR